MPAGRDSVDHLIDQWRETDPGLDVRTVEVIARLGRVRAHIASSMEAVYAQHGLTAGDFAALSILRRAGTAGAPMGALADGLALTGGTVTTRVKRLITTGLAEEGPPSSDHRVRRIRLTPAGRTKFDAAAPDHLANQRYLLAALDYREQEDLAGLLRVLLSAYESGDPPADG